MEGFDTFETSCYANFGRELSAFRAWLSNELKGRDDAVATLQNDLARTRCSNEELTLKLDNALEELDLTKKTLRFERSRVDRLSLAAERDAPSRRGSPSKQDVLSTSTKNKEQNDQDAKYQSLLRKYNLMKRQTIIYKKSVDLLTERLRAASTARISKGGNTDDQAANDIETQGASLTQNSFDSLSDSPSKGAKTASDTSNSCVILKVKRKRSKSPTTSVGPDGSRDQPFKIKEELSSSPIELRALLGGHPTSDNLDLDELAGAVETPRKRRRLQMMLENRMRQALVSTPSPTKPSIQVFESSAVEIRAVDVEVSEYDSNSQDSDVDFAFKTISSPLPLQIPTSEAQNALVRSAGAHSTAKAHPGNRTPLHKSRVLTPLSVNRRGLQTSHTRFEKRQNGRADDKAIAALAEDGSFCVDTSTSNTGLQENPGLRDDASQIPGIARLEGLLQRQKSPRNLLTSNGILPNTSIKVHLQSTRRDHTLESSASGQEFVTLATATPLPPVNAPQLSAQTLKTNSARQPLRDRPVEELRLEDFKVNPTRNQGVDFAFTEVVRNQEQRKGMAHCTRPECCGGSFSKALQIAGAPERRSGLSGDLSPSRNDDDLLLRDYLGSGCTLDDVRKLRPEERSELLGKARVASFAASNGKHRHSRHRRQSTPPGFWRTDMPSTQEMEQDRSLAIERERRKIQERYAEALQAQGLWKFRDE